MIIVRKSYERGHANHGWLDSYHSFSFGDYFDPKYTGFRNLLVINEDRVKGGGGFARHGHQNMEIISYVLEGALEHKDSLGTGSVLKYGDVQRMSAGKGVLHSEFNHSKEETVHFLQIWITPSKEGLAPSYEEKYFSIEEKRNRLKLIVSPDGEADSLKVNQDTRIYSTVLDEREAIEFTLGKGRFSWVQVAKGTLEVNGVTLVEGDGASISDEQQVRMMARQFTEVLVFDLN